MESSKARFTNNVKHTSGFYRFLVKQPMNWENTGIYRGGGRTGYVHDWHVCTPLDGPVLPTRYNGDPTLYPHETTKGQMCVLVDILRASSNKMLF